MMLTDCTEWRTQLPR